METLLKDITGEIYLIRNFDSIHRLDNLDSLFLKQESIKLFGKEIMQPRLSALYGKQGTNYKYSGKLFKSLSWSGWIEELGGTCSKICEVEFNTALLNYYRDGNDSMGLHADDERELGKNPIIASVSYGATRKMIFRRNSDKEKLIIALNSGDLLIMKGALQHNWKHEIRKEKKVEEGRLNVTFRKVNW